MDNWRAARVNNWRVARVDNWRVARVDNCRAAWVDNWRAARVDNCRAAWVDKWSRACALTEWDRSVVVDSISITYLPVVGLISRPGTLCLAFKFGNCVFVVLRMNMLMSGPSY